ncbi:hypothetical protein B7494_g5014 [Chlorociboria aeruginascens]|nr:hypothetical protein B7494_g5014 [Chlorociboria aeruginascens]
MLSWWLGTSQDGNRVKDENAEIDPPETPAPIFAARALKSALFGTPAPPHEDDTTYRIDKPADMIKERGNRNVQSVNASPAKPQGILLTPGTATTRRKTVSFGTEVMDNEKSDGEKSVGKGGVPTKSISESDAGSLSRKTSLTKILENSREGKAPKIRSSRRRSPLGPDAFDDICTVVDVEPPKSVQSGAKKPSKLEVSNQELLQEMIEGDMTMDLNEPHSQSGKYWKAEFQKYHEDAKTEMRKLVKYKQLATTFAMKKDAEAIDLAERLEEEQKRVITMEENIAKLITQIANKEEGGAGDEAPELDKELARQTALAAQYRSEVEDFRLALERKESRVVAREGPTAQEFASPRPEQTLLETHKELKKARGQLKQMALLQEELQNVRQSLSVAERTAEKLREENNKLSQDLTNSNLRMEKYLEKCEKRRSSFEEHRKKKDGELQNLQKDYGALKEIAKSQRKDAEHLLKKRHDQVVELKKDIANLKGADPPGDELQQAMAKMAIEHDQVIRGYQKQISILLGEKSSSKENLRLEKKENARQPGSTSSNLPTTEISHPRESGIPVLATSTRSKNIAPTKEAYPDPAISAMRSSQPALVEITNTANAEKFPSQQLGQVQFTPLASRFSAMSLESPSPDLPAQEPLVPNPANMALRERRYVASPRPSMFNLASSPPKPGLLRSQTSGDVLIRQSNSEARKADPLASSRLSNTEKSRIRAALPPERVAAAKARLEQKLAEKKRIKALEADQENIKN